MEKPHSFGVKHGESHVKAKKVLEEVPGPIGLLSETLGMFGCFFCMNPWINLVNFWEGSVHQYWKIRYGPWDTAGYCGILRDTVGYCGILWDTVGYCGILWVWDGRNWRAREPSHFVGTKFQPERKQRNLSEASKGLGSHVVSHGAPIKIPLDLWIEMLGVLLFTWKIAGCDGCSFPSYEKILENQEFWPIPISEYIRYLVWLESHHLNSREFLGAAEGLLWDDEYLGDPRPSKTWK